MLAVLSGLQQLNAQSVEESYAKTLWCANDTFRLKFSNYPKTFSYRVSSKGKEDAGTDAELNGYMMLYYGKDSLRLPYHNHVPYAHIIYVDLESPAGKTRIRLHFNDLYSYFPEDYQQQSRKQVRFEIPEAYELANIIWALSPAGQRATDLNTKGSYYRQVVDHFKPYLNHPLFRRLDVPAQDYFNRYYDFRENSFAFRFRDQPIGSSGLVMAGPFYHVWGNELADSSLFGKLKPLVEHFATVSGFRQFYKSHAAFYARQLKRQQELMPISTMWSWLEKEFPRSTHDAYRIVFSPLTGGSHSTQNYYGQGFKEVVMFVCGPERIDRDTALNEQQKESLLSGIVFTEIDHNHVNPETRRYRAQVDSIFSKRKAWVKEPAAGNHYTTATSVFNEYMTHAVFCLYLLGTYDTAAAEFATRKREALMVEQRGFIRFREFNTELLRLRQQHKELKTEALYPLILSWCRIQE